MRLLYDGALANFRLDTHPAAAQLAKQMVELVLETARRA